MGATRSASTGFSAHGISGGTSEQPDEPFEREQVTHHEVGLTLDDTDGADILDIGRSCVRRGCQCEVNEGTDALDQGFEGVKRDRKVDRPGCRQRV